jgi:hypothetical protein
MKEQNNASVPPEVAETKQYRKDLDEVLQRIKNSSRKSRERSLVVTKLQEAIMWLGMDLKELGTPNPYPNSYNPESKVVDPTADGLKL